MRNRSLFWPFFLIAAGIVWLLVEMHNLPIENLWALMYIWPFLLMAAGVNLILRVRWPVTRGFVSSVTVLCMLIAVLFAPRLGWNRPPAWNFLSIGGFNGSVAGSGVVVSQTRQLADFNTIEINYPVELTVQQGNANSLTVTAENNLVPQLASHVSGTTLTIVNNQPDWTRRVTPTRPVTIHMTVKDLQQVDFPSAGTLTIGNFQTDHMDLSISGAGTVNLSNLTTHKLAVNLSGAGNITASGSADNLDLDISGLGGFHGADLASQTAGISISGAGNATVWAKSNLNVQISGTGSVNYYGSPQVSREVSGLGTITSQGTK
jgi:hypothetical protein